VKRRIFELYMYTSRGAARGIADAAHAAGRDMDTGRVSNVQVRKKKYSEEYV
jgi:hypothetical protein